MKVSSPRQVFEARPLHAHSQADSSPRVLFVYAHPDDEMIAVGGHLPLFREALFLQVTDGAPADNSDGNRLGLSRSSYRATRALELGAAFAAAGLPEARHRCLNVADKEAALHLAEIARAVAEVLRSEQPDVIFTHPYEGGHADHDACAFAVHTAVRMAGLGEALIVESPFYFAAADGSMRTGSFLAEQLDGNDVILPLDVEQQQRKRAAFAAFATQRDVLTAFAPALLQERFRIAPPCNFALPACPGRACYESFIPGMTPARFVELAMQAQSELMTNPVAA